MKSPQGPNLNSDQHKNSQHIKINSVDIEKEAKSAPRSNIRRKIFSITREEYWINGTLHGIKYLAQDRRWTEKLFWTAVIFVSIFCCSNLIYNTYIKWCETPVIVSFSEKSTPVWNIPFPAVTLCAEIKSVKDKSLDFTRFYNQMKSFRHRTYEPPKNITPQDLNHFRSLLQICGNHLIENIQFPTFNTTDYYQNLDEIVPPFERTYPFCKWVTHLGTCNEVFFKTYTEEGICYTFNGLNVTEIYRNDTFQYKNYLNSSTTARKLTTRWSLQEGYQDNTGIQSYPARVLGAGPRAGLFVNLQSFEQNEDFICRGAVDGFKVILHSPDDVPRVSRHFIRVALGKEVLVLVKPNMITTLDAISGYDPNRRQCFFNTERYLRYFQVYTQSNCELECLTNYTLSKCGCVKFSMPRAPDTPVCDESKIHCYDLAEDDLLIHEFAEGLTDSKLKLRARTKCNCLPSCTSLIYNTEISQGDYNIEKLLKSHGDTTYFKENVGAHLSRLSMYFKENQFITSKRSELYGVTDFIANCGGIFGLFMGFSALSVVEVFYYLTFRLIINLKNSRSE